MSNIKVMMHRMLQSSCRQSQEKIVKKLKTMSNFQGRKFWDNPCVRLFGEKLNMVGEVFGKQCNVIAAHRARRSAQILDLYRNLYGERTASHLFKALGQLLRTRSDGKLFFLLGAVFFDWNENKVTDQDLDRVADDLKAFVEAHSSKTSGAKTEEGDKWEKVVDSDNFKLWRCPVNGSSLYKYKVYGKYTDICARSFYNIQLDLEYRKKWDNHVIRLETVDVDAETGSEVVYWATHFPLALMYSRDYVYVRRCKIDHKQNFMMLTAQSVNHPSFPINNDYVRVGQYTSQMLIKPHTSFDENGFDYVMSYYDDPQLYVPTWAINKMTLSSLPAFITTLHSAAMKYSSSGDSDQSTKVHC